MLDKHRVRASLQHGVESVSLGGWTVELRVVVEALSQLIHHPFPWPFAASIVTSRLTVDFDNVTGGSEGSAVGRSIPQSRTERKFAVVVFVHFLYACAVNSINQPINFYLPMQFHNKKCQLVIKTVRIKVTFECTKFCSEETVETVKYYDI